MIYAIDLSGEWGLCLDPEKHGITGGYCCIKAGDSITLPSTLSFSGKVSENPERETGCLTDRYAYEGWAWYYRSADLSGIPENCRAVLYLERTRMTRLWVNGVPAGENDSLCTPHTYDITDLITDGMAELCLLVSNTDYPTKGGHMTSPDTQTNWNGITGEIKIIVYERPHIAELHAYPDAERRSVTLRYSTEGVTGAAELLVWGVSSDGMVVEQREFTVPPSGEVTLPLGENASLWSEYTPVTYTLKAALKGSADIATVTFGLRSFTAEGLHFRINGQPVRLRGEHCGLLFPNSIAAPTTVEEWSEYLLKLKGWGLNHLRFHTCCPPEAAFTAADILGVYMQPELPFWGTITAPGEEGFDRAEQEFLIREGERILHCFGSHPSFVMMSLGNELWGSTDRLNSILRLYRKLDPRHLYTQGSNNFQFYPNILPCDDFFSGVRLSRDRLIRGSYAACDAPLGFVQTEEPNTVHSYDGFIFPECAANGNSGDDTEIEIQYGTGVRKVKVGSAAGELIPDKPIVTHEVGQYCTYPDYSETEQYRSSLRPYNLLEFRERLAQNGMASYAEDFHRASGMLAYNCYKLEIEAALRSEYISGFQLLGLQDFTGQGTALVGMLNACLNQKSFVREYGIRERWNGFCSDTAVLAEIDSFVLTVGETITVHVLLNYMQPEEIIGAKVRWSFGRQSGELTVPDSTHGLAQLGKLELCPSASGKYSLTLGLEDFPANSYDLWAFPAASDDFALSDRSVRGDSTVYITSDLAQVRDLLAVGGKVLYLPEDLPGSIEGFYCTDFWCYPMFRTISESMDKPVPVGTLGLLIDSLHPALSLICSESYSTPQWYHIVTHSRMAVLDGTPEKFRPIVQCIDNFERNHKLGMLYEARVGGGLLMVCTSQLSDTADRPETQVLAAGILDYMHSVSFAPEHELSLSQLGLE